MSDKKWFKIGEVATMWVAEQAPGEPAERGPAGSESRRSEADRER